MLVLIAADYGPDFTAKTQRWASEAIYDAKLKSIHTDSQSRIRDCCVSVTEGDNAHFDRMPLLQLS